MPSEKALVNQQEIENRILTIRGKQVMIDRDLAELYDVSTKAFNQSVKRNEERFPDTFKFQLSEEEKKELVTNCDRFESLKHSSSLPYAFTEQGVAMLSAVLRSETAVKVSIQVIEAFIKMRNLITDKAGIFQRLDRIERKQIETDEKFERIFDALKPHEPFPNEGIFYDGQVFDAYAFASNLIRSAKREIILIDNYVDDTILILFLKRKKGVRVTIYTAKVNKQLALDIQKHNEQYEPIELKVLKKAHDRFLIIDGNDLYHIGASLKDLGKKWFAFSKMDIEIGEIFSKLNK